MGCERYHIHWSNRKFPTKAKSGARYIMIMVSIYNNTVLAATLKHKPDKEQQLAHLALLKRLKKQRLKHG